jgi:type I restriction enzyme S subunit
MMLQEIAAPKGFIGGPFGSNLVSKDYVETGVPVIRGSNMGRTGHLEPPFVYVAEDKLKRDLSRNVARAGNLIFTQRGTLGQVVLLRGDSEDRYVISQSQMGLVVDKKVADARYVYYACTTKDFLAQIDSRAIRTGVPHLNLGILRELTIPRMSLGEQIAIAAVLGALDDKIAANQRVEFSSWQMIDAQAKLASSVEPRTTSLGDLIRLNYGRALPVAQRRGGEVAVMGSGGEVGRHEEALVPGPSVIVGRKGSVGATYWVDGPAYPIDTTYWVEPVGVPLLYAFTVLKSIDFSGMSTDSAVPGLNRDRAYAIPVALPSPERLRTFELCTASLVERAAAANDENRRLAATRDELLPLLMSGKITVKDAEKTVEEVV